MEKERQWSSMADPNHPYLCWLDQVRGIGRRTRFALLAAAARRNLFQDDFPENMQEDFQEDGCGEACFGKARGDGCERAVSSEEGGTQHPVSSGAEPETFTGMTQLAAAAKILYTAPEARLRFLCGEAFPAGGRGEKMAAHILAARKQDPGRIVRDLERAGIHFFSFLEEGYPARLRDIPDPPFGLYCRGKMPTDADPAAGVIGARLASGYGREQARRFGYQLGRSGIAVISGMARGVDGIAQKAALEAGGASFAVLGCGVDICYPEENRPLYDRLVQEGGVLSEYPPGMPPEPRMFPPRNRIISGLSDLLLVIEARKKSGTLITVDMALEQGREVYALPGRVSDRLSDGCNRLLRQGAGVATCPEDILEYFAGTEREKTWLSQGARKGEKETAERSSAEKEATVKEEVPAEREASVEKKASAEKKEPVEKKAFAEKGAHVEAPGKKEASAEREAPAEKKVSVEKKVPAGKKMPWKGAKGRARGERTLEEEILQILSAEDEMHLDRILEALNREPEEKGAGCVRLTDLMAALFRLQGAGKVREEPAGYYTKRTDCCYRHIVI